MKSLLLLSYTIYKLNPKNAQFNLIDYPELYDDIHTKVLIEEFLTFNKAKQLRLLKTYKACEIKRLIQSRQLDTEILNKILIIASENTNTLSNYNIWIDIIKLIFTRHKNVNYFVKQNVVLKMASLRGEYDIVEYLLTHSAKKEFKVGINTCIQHAIIGGNLKIVKSLVPFSKTISKHYTIIGHFVYTMPVKFEAEAYLATRYGHLDIVKFLYELNEKMHNSDRIVNIIYTASSYGHTHIIHHFLQLITLTSNIIDKIATNAIKNDKINVLSYLKAKKLNFNSLNCVLYNQLGTDGRLVTEGELFKKSFKLVYFLLTNDYKFCLKFLDRYFDSLILKCKFFNELTDLIKLGANTCNLVRKILKEDWKMPLSGRLLQILEHTHEQHLSEMLEVVCKYDRIDIVDYLIKRGADISYNRNKAICVAMENLRISLARHLVNQGLKGDLSRVLISAYKHGFVLIVQELKTLKQKEINGTVTF